VPEIRLTAPFVIAIGVISLAGMAWAQHVSTAGAGAAWVYVAAAACGAIAVAAGMTAIRRCTGAGVAVFAVQAAVVTSLAIFVVAAPSGSASCQQSTDCDTSFGLGLPFLVVALFIPYVVCAGAGWALRVRSRRQQLTPF